MEIQQIPRFRAAKNDRHISTPLVLAHSCLSNTVRECLRTLPSPPRGVKHRRSCPRNGCRRRIFHGLGCARCYEIAQNASHVTFPPAILSRCETALRCRERILELIKPRDCPFGPVTYPRGIDNGGLLYTIRERSQRPSGLLTLHVETTGQYISDEGTHSGSQTDLSR